MIEVAGMKSEMFFQIYGRVKYVLVKALHIAISLEVHRLYSYLQICFESLVHRQQLPGGHEQCTNITNIWRAAII